MTDDDLKQAYWRRIRRLTAAMISLFAAALIFMPGIMLALNSYRILRFPLGYFLVSHIGIVVFVLLVYGFFRGQERSDSAYNVTLQF
jgi:putative solute:sodium symporter small subunit